MRTMKFLGLATFAFAAAPLLSTPAIADDTQIIRFVSGTGDAPVVADHLAYSDTQAPERDPSAAMNDMADKLSSPHMQDDVAHMVEAMTTAMLRLPVGHMATAIEKARPGILKRRIRDDATLADVAGRDARDLPETLSDKSRDMMGMMGGFAKAFAVMIPELQKMGDDMEASYKNAKASRRE